MLTSLNIILFFVFCVFIIIEQSGTIDEVKKLYFKLSQTNEELQQANEKLQEYAVMKEKWEKQRSATGWLEKFMIH